jgi:hypothetical protein
MRRAPLPSAQQAAAHASFWPGTGLLPLPLTRWLTRGPRAVIPNLPHRAGLELDSDRTPAVCRAASPAWPACQGLSTAYIKDNAATRRLFSSNPSRPQLSTAAR